MKEKERKVVENMIDELMLRQEGRIFLRALIESSGIFKPIQSSDKEIVMYYEGKRAFGLDLIKIMNNQNKDNLSIVLKSESNEMNVKSED